MDTLALQVTGLHKQYGTKTVLSDVDLAIATGEVLCILGPNGAGKTTLISAILGLVNSDAGSIQLFGATQMGLTRSTSLRQQLGVMMQIGSLSANLTVAEQCDLFSHYYANSYSVTELLQIAGLEEQAKQRFSRLSGGQKQRLLFAIALAGKPKLVFLDEPTLGMDVEARRALWQQIRQLKHQGVAVLLTTHYMEEVEQLADRIVVLNQGKVVTSGSPTELKALMAYKVIQCQTQLSDPELLALPGVLQVSRSNGLAIMHSNHAQQTVQALLNADFTLAQLDVRAVALEDVFLQITRHSPEECAV